LENNKIAIVSEKQLHEILKNSGGFPHSTYFHLPHSLRLRSGQAAGSAKQYSIIFWIGNF